MSATAPLTTAMEACAARLGHSLAGGFLTSACRAPDRIALEVAGTRFTYRELWQSAAAIAATFQDLGPGRPPLTAVNAYRSAVAYAGVLAALLRGHGYVPLNPRDPAGRTRSFIEQTGARELVVDREGENILGDMLSALREPVTVVLPERATVVDLQQRWPRHRFRGARDLRPAAALKPGPVDRDAAAYVLFTSGSTGTPKGVRITHRNISHLLATMVRRYGINERDRVAQFADLTFDPSVSDIFTAWACGAAVCCPGAGSLLNPAPFLADQAITIFHSVPSNGLMMKRLGELKSGRFPRLRVTLFGGEALPSALCSDWRAAAPDSVIENVYGPTEFTIDATAYRWDARRSPPECRNGIVPIGSLLPGVHGMVVDGKLHEVAEGEMGELLLAGPQRSPGYVNDAERTSQVMVAPPGTSELYYRTGDLASKPAGKDYYVFRGRMDFQVKIFGTRVELGEIENALREVTGKMEVAALGWPPTATGVAGIVAFVGATDIDPSGIREALRHTLPRQMVPRQIRMLATLPRNRNGKVDRLQLRRQLEDQC